MTFEPLTLFRDKREGVVIFGILFLIFCLHVSFEYIKYQSFTQYKVHKTVGVVENIYQKINKNNNPYHVLRLKTDSFTIYSTLWKKPLHVKRDSAIKFSFFTKNISFTDFLKKRFFTPTFKYKAIKTKETFSHTLFKFINKQHKTFQMQELYSALFLAKPIGKKLRAKVQNWGISHLIAISGFHLGVLFGVMFFIFKLFYKPLQDRFFPYRDLRFDLSIFIFFLLSFYLYLIDFTPSFLRAYVMSMLGFFFYMRYFKVVSFTNLSLTIALVLAFFPNLAFSVGFWFSVGGVFYIFLYFYHFKDSFSNLTHTILINIWVFLGMNVPVYWFFGYVSWQQFGSIILSILFVLFYPLAMVLHLFGIGGLLDEPLTALLHVSIEGRYIVLSDWYAIGYIILSLISIFNRYLATAVVLSGVVIFFM